MMLLCSGCTPLLYEYDKLTTFNRPKSSEPIRGLMASDWGCDPKLKKYRKDDAKKLREAGYNTIYIVADMATKGHGARPYAVPGRKQTIITSTFEKNIRLIYRWGFRVMVVVGNEPTVRHGYSHLMESLGRQPGLQPHDLYTNYRLENEKKCWKDLWEKRGPWLHSAMLYLEPITEPSSEVFCKKLYAYIRSLGFKGPLFNNTNLYTIHGTFQAPSINFIDDWVESNSYLKNSDGMQNLNGGTAASYVPLMIKTAGPGGWIIWWSDYKGSAAGRGKLHGFHYRHVRDALGN